MDTNVVKKRPINKLGTFEKPKILIVVDDKLKYNEKTYNFSTTYRNEHTNNIG
jgi:hypothetical protein